MLAAPLGVYAQPSTIVDHRCQLHSQVFTQAQLLIYRDQLATFTTITNTLTHLLEEASVEEQLHELIKNRKKAASTKRHRTSQQPTSPAAMIKTPIKMPMARKQEPKPIIVDDDEVDTPPASDHEDPEEEIVGSTDDDGDSNLGTEEEDANTDDMCDDGSDEEPRGRGRRGRRVCWVVVIGVASLHVHNMLAVLHTPFPVLFTQFPVLHIPFPVLPTHILPVHHTAGVIKPRGFSRSRAL